MPHRIAGLILACWGLVACPSPQAGKTPATAAPEPAVAVIDLAKAPSGPDWGQAHDCQGMLVLLRRGLEDGRIIDLDGTPFALIDDATTPASSRWPRAGSFAAPAEARCILRVDRAIDRKSEHRLLGRETVRSRYQSGTRVEKNPAYEVAKARLRQAEKAVKPGKSSIIKVGDPLIDLVGTLVGGALTGLGEWGAGDQLEEALDTLMATPPSIEKPKYKSYQFELRRVRARREATLPLILTDRHLGRSWEVALKRREQRDLAVVDGLDRLDENYARHRQESLTEAGLQQWLAEAPSLPLVDIAAGLLNRPSAIPVDRLALAKGGGQAVEAERLDEEASIDAAALPTLRRDRSAVAAEQPSLMPRSYVTLIGEAAKTEGVFVAPNVILTASEAIGQRGLVDIEDRPGHVALGLVAAIDHGLGLALVQSPMAGHPVMVGHAPQRSHGRSKAAPPSNNAIAAPWLVDGALAGFKMANGPDIDGKAIHLFLEQKKHLLPTHP